VIPDFSLCRFRAGDDTLRLGLINESKLYDLTALGRSRFNNLEAWLTSIKGDLSKAFAELADVPFKAQPICSVEELVADERAPHLVAPIDTQEVWACGVTYEMSREARMRESEEPTIYGRVYDAPRPEIFFKATPHRVVGPNEAVAIRGDSEWDVPEPEMALVVTPELDIVGYTVGNDMSSRSIEGENPLYLPQAKVYDRCCSLGPVIRLAKDFDALNQAVTLKIHRDGEVAFEGETHTSQIHRSLEGLVSYLGRCNSIPAGAFVLTGTGIVPPDTFTLAQDDVVEIIFEGLGTLSNPVIELAVE
jgi:2-dehydro-3-deoxy-D-arabinonate dehydratase